MFDKRYMSLLDNFQAELAKGSKYSNAGGQQLTSPLEVLSCLHKEGKVQYLTRGETESDDVQRAIASLPGTPVVSLPSPGCFDFSPYCGVWSPGCWSAPSTWATEPPPSLPQGG
jgi:hypothetical protein